MHLPSQGPESTGIGTGGGAHLMIGLSVAIGVAVGVLTLANRPRSSAAGGGDAGEPGELGESALPPPTELAPPAPGMAASTAPARPTASWTVHGPLLTWHTTSTTSAAASVHGELTQRHGCLSIGTHPAIWPHGTTWDEATRTLTLPDGTRARIGTALRGAGGYTSAERLCALSAREVGGQQLTAFLRAHLEPSARVVVVNSISTRGDGSGDGDRPRPEPRHEHHHD
ncbi:hypothetical protein [Kineococcus sp. SYSU DK005]|uniref:hypothetical protein n=1 Tax=Kineococcus sp. SYSU DK005 TaxID=3383126 RepID=UPI003D7EACA3